MQEVMTFGAEAGGAVGHDTFSLSGADFAAKIGFAGFAEFAFAAFGGTGIEDKSESGVLGGRRRGSCRYLTRAQQRYRLLSLT